MTNSIQKIFIANRGEIARRIALTAQKLGIKTVALTDKKTPPSFLTGVVSEFIYIEQESTKVYLDPKLMIEYAKSAHCDAIHPGFGFLSENSEFAALVESSGMTWIGPSPAPIEQMASKATARMHAEKAKVPCLPGINGLSLATGDSAVKTLQDFAKTSGFPLLIKAAYGGGGKGMRIVENAETLLENAKRAEGEAISSFGNGSLIIEKYLPSSRHVEIQVLADKHGNVAIIGDRDCSLQRRHQKILEEAPAPNIPDHVRTAMHDAARSLAKIVGYDNAGTVEFLLEESNPSKVQFYFLEMNTRLQVEHTVTEEVFGLDLVEWQIRIAQGAKLPAQLLVPQIPRGHSIEVRIYAEDPGANFFPAPGPVRAFVPARGRGVRWEIGLDTVDEITTSFDPMISKLICSAGDRLQALDLLTQTLDRTLFSGPRNNIPFLIWLTQHPKVRKNPVDTHFIASHLADALKWEGDFRSSSEERIKKLTAYIQRSGQSLDNGQLSTEYDSMVDRVTRSAFSSAAVSSPQSTLNIQITSRNQASNPNQPFQTSHYGFGLFTKEKGARSGFSYTKFLSPDRCEHWIGLNGHNWVEVDEKTVVAGSGTSQANSQGDGLTAPVPGKVFSILVSPGMTVKSGQILFILESMKMQFEVRSTLAGEIKAIHVKEGGQVTSGQKLGDWV